MLFLLFIDGNFFLADYYYYHYFTISWVLLSSSLVLL